MLGDEPSFKRGDVYDGLYFAIAREPIFRQVRRPPDAKSQIHGETLVKTGWWFTGHTPGVVAAASDWNFRGTVEPCEGGCYRICGQTDLFGTIWWDDGTYPSKSAGGRKFYRWHEEEHVARWTSRWSIYANNIRRFDPEDCTSGQSADCKLEWMEWIAAISHAKGQIDQGLWDIADYPDPELVDYPMLRFYANYFNLLLANQPSCSGFKVNVHEKPISIPGLPQNPRFGGQPPGVPADVLSP